jgi:hypothetical protein
MKSEMSKYNPVMRKRNPTNPALLNQTGVGIATEPNSYPKGDLWTSRVNHVKSNQIGTVAATKIAPRGRITHVSCDRAIRSGQL